MKSAGIVYHGDYLKHYTGHHHPERAERLRAIMKRLDTDGLTDKLELIAPAKAAKEQLGYIHQGAYVTKVEVMSSRGGGMLDLDTPVCRDSFEVARLAAGGLLKAVDTVMESEVKRIFALVRPPGHHATATRGMGFCIFNNIAIAAEHLKREYGIRRILIVDWDVHHGNGTQDAFLSDPSVLYFSTHQYPHYPGTGWLDEPGIGAGEGYTVNVPLPAGTDDAGYLYVFNSILLPIAMEFKPEFVLISAGFDPHIKDPLASMNVSSRGFGLFMEVMKKIAADYSDDRLVATLEGGYDLHAIAESASAVVSAMLSPDTVAEREVATTEAVKNRVEEVKSVQRRYWHTLS